MKTINTFLCLLFGILSAFAQTESEPNGTTGTADVVGINSTTFASIQEEGDIDFFEIQAANDGVLTIAIENIPSSIDIELGVQDAGGGTIFSRVSSTAGTALFAELLVKSATTYYLRISDRYNNSSSSEMYQLTLAFDGTDACEFNQTLGSACTIPTNTSLEAKILGYTNSNALDVDFYRIEPTATGVVVIEISQVPMEIDVELKVLDESGSLLFSRLASVEGAPVSAQLLVEAGSVYYLEIADRYNNSYSFDPYTLTLSLDVTDACEFNQSLGNACLIPTDGSRKAKILGYTASNALDVDFYRIEPSVTGVVAVEISEVPGELDMELHILDDGGNILFTRVASSGGTPIAAQILVEAGAIYYLEVADRYNNSYSFDTYTLTLSMDDTDACEFNQTIGDACLIPVDGSQTAKILGYANSNTLDVDVYEINPTSTGVVKIDITNVPMELDMELQVLDGGGNILFTRVASTEGTPVSVPLLVEAGEVYYLEVADRYDNAYSFEPYTLTLAFDDTDICEFNQTLGEACLVGTDVVLTSKILGYTASNTLDVDFYRIEPEQSGVVKIDITNVPGELDMELTVKAETGLELFSRVASTEGTPVSVPLLVEAGEVYYLEIADRYDNAYSCDPYTLTLAFDGTDECEFNQSRTEACEISTDTTFLAQILGYTASNTLDQDFYALTAPIGGMLHVDLTEVPLELDLELTVYDDNGAEIDVLIGAEGAPVFYERIVMPGERLYLQISDRYNDAYSCDAYRVTLSYEGTDAIIENPFSNQIQIAPNPVLDHLFLSSELKIQQIELLGIQGQRLRHWSNETLKPSLFMGDVPRGLHLLRIHTERGVILKQIIKN